MHNTHHSLLVAACLYLAACGGGESSPAPPPSAADSISTKTLNPAAAVQSTLTFSGTATDSVYRYQFSAGTPETIDGTVYQVQNVLRLDSFGVSSTFKNYYTANPLSIFNPPYSFVSGPSNFPNRDTVYNTLSKGMLPTSARVGDFGIYQTSTALACPNFGGTTCTRLADETSPWTLEKNTDTTARLCIGVDNNPRLTPRTCFIMDANSQIVR
jgi:hypothetical protein